MGLYNEYKKLLGALIKQEKYIDEQNNLAEAERIVMDARENGSYDILKQEFQEFKDDSLKTIKEQQSLREDFKAAGRVVKRSTVISNFEKRELLNELRGKITDITCELSTFHSSYMVGRREYESQIEDFENRGHGRNNNGISVDDLFLLQIDR
ncbi:MAG: hypothetical protein FWE45_04560 [Firmicutes bacterium]|nr:hypothetical protein [Bacillota bacterium]